MVLSNETSSFYVIPFAKMTLSVTESFWSGRRSVGRSSQQPRRSVWIRLPLRRTITSNGASVWDSGWFLFSFQLLLRLYFKIGINRAPQEKNAVQMLQRSTNRQISLEMYAASECCAWQWFVRSSNRFNILFSFFLNDWKDHEIGYCCCLGAVKLGLWSSYLSRVALYACRSWSGYFVGRFGEWRCTLAGYLKEISRMRAS